jgi:hypothetical protein
VLRASLGTRSRSFFEMARSDADFLRSADEADFAAFFRALLLALGVALLVWLVLGIAAVQVYWLAGGNA